MLSTHFSEERVQPKTYVVFLKSYVTNQSKLEAFALQVHSCVCKHWTSNPEIALYKETRRVRRAHFLKGKSLKPLYI